LSACDSQQIKIIAKKIEKFKAEQVSAGHTTPLTVSEQGRITLLADSAR